MVFMCFPFSVNCSTSDAFSVVPCEWFVSSIRYVKG